MMATNDIRDTGDVMMVTYEDENTLTKGKKTFNRVMTHNYVPRYFRVSKHGTIYMTSLAEAGFVFVTVRARTTDNTGAISFVWRGMVFHGYCLKLGKVSYLYMSTNDTITGAPYVKAAIASYAVVNLTQYYYNDPTSLANVRLHFGTSNKHKMPTATHVKRLIDLPTSKITGDHHTHYMVSEVLAAFSDKGHDEVTTAIAKMTNATQAFAAGVLAWYWSLTPLLRECVRYADMWNASNVEDWAKAAKHASRFFKAMQNCIEHDLRSLFEIDVLANRGIGEVDWGAERDHRTNPEVVNVSCGEVYAEACRVFARAKIEGRSPSKMDWDKYWNNRWQYTPTGSIHSQHKVDSEYVFKERTIKNKFMSLIRMPNELKLEYFTNRYPETHAWSSVKWE
jgi:hypothetical protein